MNEPAWSTYPPPSTPRDLGAPADPTTLAIPTRSTSRPRSTQSPISIFLMSPRQLKESLVSRRIVDSESSFGDDFNSAPKWGQKVALQALLELGGLFPGVFELGPIKSFNTLTLNRNWSNHSKRDVTATRSFINNHIAIDTDLINPTGSQRHAGSNPAPPDARKHLRGAVAEAIARKILASSPETERRFIEATITTFTNDPLAPFPWASPQPAETIAASLDVSRKDLLRSTEEAIVLAFREHFIHRNRTPYARAVWESFQTLYGPGAHVRPRPSARATHFPWTTDRHIFPQVEYPGIPTHEPSEVPIQIGGTPQQPILGIESASGYRTRFAHRNMACFLAIGEGRFLITQLLGNCAELVDVNASVVNQRLTTTTFSLPRPLIAAAGAPVGLDPDCEHIRDHQYLPPELLSQLHGIVNQAIHVPQEIAVLLNPPATWIDVVRHMEHSSDLVSNIIFDLDVVRSQTLQPVDFPVETLGEANIITTSKAIAMFNKAGSMLMTWRLKDQQRLGNTNASHPQPPLVLIITNEASIEIDYRTLDEDGRMTVNVDPFNQNHTKPYDLRATRQDIESITQGRCFVLEDSSGVTYEFSEARSVHVFDASPISAELRVERLAQHQLFQTEFTPYRTTASPTTAKSPDTPSFGN